MGDVTVSVRTVDGGFNSWTAPPQLAETYAKLVAEGLSGKQLMHRLLTDDWGPPPVTVTLAWDGKEIVIPYR